MRKKILFGILLTIVAANAPAQYLKLFGNPDRHALYFNTDRLWSYNLYEHSRWGGGLRYSWNNVGATLKSLTSDVYLGYGTADKRWKWGVNVDAALAKPINWHLYASYFDDLIPVGTRHMDTYQLTDISSYTNFMSRRFSTVRRLALGMRFNPSKTTSLGIEARLSSEYDLFHSDVVIYPAGQYDDFFLFHARYAEALFSLQHNTDFKSQLLIFWAEGEGPVPDLRWLGQYSHAYKLGPFSMSLYSQAGITTNHHVYYSRMFDLGGNMGSPVFFQRSLLTAAPNEFTANTFALVTARLGLTKPLFNIYNNLFRLGSSPRPFLQVGAAWGWLWGQDEYGHRLWAATPFNDLVLQSPYQGIFEGAAGVNALVKWGLVDWGIAAAYRLTPSSAAYHRQGAAANFTYMITATLSL